MKIDDDHSSEAVDLTTGPNSRRATDPIRSTSGTGARAPATYLLVRQPPNRSGDRRSPEWVLEAWSGGGRRSWTMTLARRGAGPGADARTAGAVAVRVLAEHAVVVEGWEHLGTDRLPMYVARLRPMGRGGPPSRSSPVTDDTGTQLS